MKKGEVLVAVTCVLLLILVGIRLYVQDRTVTLGTKLQQLQNRVTSLEADNALLREKVLQYSAYTTIEKEASQEGFVKAQILVLH